MTNRHIMTEEEARALPMPETHHLRTRNGEWAPVATRAAGPEPWVLAHIAADVANGHLPRPVYDWALRAYKGGEVPTPEMWDARVKLLEDLGGQLKAEADWRDQFGGTPPTPEQWEAAEQLAAMARNDAHPDSIVTKLANIIDPPKPPPLPEIAACPYCGGECRMYGAGNSWHVECVASSTEEHVACCYHGPTAPTNRAAIESHNRVAERIARLLQRLDVARGQNS